MKDNSVEQNNTKRSTKKKIIIYSCHGGGGHMSAARAIESYLDDYEVKTIDALGDVLASLDPFYYLTLGKYTGQDFYNFLLRRNKKRITNLFFYFGYYLRNFRKKSIKKALQKSIEKEKPDMVISVVPLLNHFFADICEKKNIPFFLIPTDLDMHSFTKDVSLKNNNKSKLCVGFDYPEINECIDKQFIPAERVKVIGFPIRKEFFEKKEKETLKKELSIDLRRPIVMLVMGATGSTASLNYIRELNKITIPFHLIICVGRSMYLHSAIKKITFSSHISYSIFNGNSDISDAMAIADLCITKPGSVTFSEILYMNIPVLIDNTTPALIWERLNLDIVKNYGLGSIITNYRQVKRMVSSYLADKELRNLTRKNIAALKKTDFGENLKDLIDQSIN